MRENHHSDRQSATGIALAITATKKRKKIEPKRARNQTLDRNKGAKPNARNIMLDPRPCTARTEGNANAAAIYQRNTQIDVAPNTNKLGTRARAACTTWQYVVSDAPRLSTAAEIKSAAAQRKHH